MKLKCDDTALRRPRLLKPHHRKQCSTRRHRACLKRARILSLTPPFSLISSSLRSFLARGPLLTRRQVLGYPLEHTRLEVRPVIWYPDTVNRLLGGRAVDATAGKNAGTTRGRPFLPGQGGRPKGSRNKTTLAMEALLDGEAELITRKAVEMAKAGDTTAMRLCLDRLLPPRKDRAVAFALPKLEAAADAVRATAALVEAVAAGELTPSEAAELSKLVEGFTRAVDLHDIQARLERLEAQQENSR